MSTRAAAWIALPLGLLNVSFALLALLFAGLSGYSFTVFLEENVLFASILAVSFSVVGAIVASHRPRNALGWILLAIGFSQGLSAFAYPYAEYALITEPGSSLPGAALMSWVGQLFWIPGYVLLFTYGPLLFPD